MKRTIWHGGTAKQVTSDMDVTDQLQAVDLDWDVLNIPGQYTNPVTQEIEDIPGHSLACRSDNGTVLDVYNKGRQSWSNREVFTAFNQFCDESEMGLTVDFVGSLNGGKQFYLAAKLPLEMKMKRDVNDITEAYLLCRDSHLDGNGQQILIYADRLICTNGMTRRVKLKQSVTSHSRAFSANDMHLGLVGALELLEAEQHKADALANVEMDEATAKVHLIRAFGHPEKEWDKQPRVVRTAFNLFCGEGMGSEMLTAYNTAYGLLNAVTETYNHHLGGRKSTAASAMNELLPGGNRYKNMHRFESQLVGAHIPTWQEIARGPVGRRPMPITQRVSVGAM